MESKFKDTSCSQTESEFVTGKIFDAHCHIYPEKIAEKASKNTGAFYGLEAAGNGTASDLIRLENQASVCGMLVHSVATKPEQVRSINRFLSETVQQHSDRMIGFGTMHPESTDLKGDFELLLESGLSGVKMHPDIQGFAVDSCPMRKIWELCLNAGIPVLIHTGDSRYHFSNPDQVVPVLRDYPDLRVIGAHFGGWSVWREAMEKLCGF